MSAETRARLDYEFGAGAFPGVEDHDQPLTAAEREVVRLLGRHGRRHVMRFVVELQDLQVRVSGHDNRYRFLTMVAWGEMDDPGDLYEGDDVPDLELGLRRSLAAL